jgi:type I restriction enzyme S subunit
MSADWPVIKLSQLTSKITKGTTPNQNDGGFSDSGINYIKAESVGFDGKIDTSKFSYISEDVHNKLKRSQLEVDDILFSMAGIHLGKVGIVEEKHVPANTNQALALIRPIKELIEPKYLFYFLQKREINHFVNNATSQSAQPNINLEQIGNLDIEVPNLNIQNSIVKILETLDRKIDLNTQTNQTLESIAQAIFKSWFVDFEPVKAKMAVLESGGTREQAELAAMGVISGKGEAELAQLQQQNPEHYKQLAETAALFPSAMVESELGEIPEGWEVSNLGEISSLITKGTTPTKSDMSSAEDEPETFFLKVKDIAGSGEVIRSGIEKIPTSVSIGALKRSVLKTDDVLFSIAGTIGRTAIVDSDLNNANANQALAIIRLLNPKKWLSFTWLNINSDRIQNEIASKVVQGVQANASLANIRDITITMPSDEILEYFNRIIDPILLEKRLLAKNTRELSELRDSLLPKLLSGEIDLTNLQSEVA